MTDVTAINWNEAWKKPEPTMEGRRPAISCADRWSARERCERYNRSAREDNWAGSLSRIEGMVLAPGFRVLDIGAGPGTLAIPLAGQVREVCAVEPSDAMRACLLSNIAESGLDNVHVVPKRWEDVDTTRDLSGRYDVVVASYSLGFPDLRDGLLKMHEASRSYVYIFWFADMLSPWQKNYGDIWEALFGIPISRYRRPNIIFNLLHQMGIYASVEVTVEDHVQRFSSMEEAVSDQGAGLNLETGEQYAVLREYLEKRLCREGDGVTLRSSSPRAKIWWKKEA